MIAKSFEEIKHKLNCLGIMISDTMHACRFPDDADWEKEYDDCQNSIANIQKAIKELCDENENLKSKREALLMLYQTTKLALGDAINENAELKAQIEVLKQNLNDMKL